MKVHISTTRRPMLAGNMTRTELVREAEHTFPNPSPIVRRMIEELRGDRTPMGGDKALPIFEHDPYAGCCPACGSALTIDFQG